jgi:CDP-diacylglycerol--inositol 3-phosphatidyltransferase
VATAIAAMYYSLSDWKLTAVLYSVSQGLDAVDGVVARHFNQCTKFGQVLDMLTDRCASSRNSILFLKLSMHTQKLCHRLCLLLCKP